MNGAMGSVRGFVWPSGGSPQAEDESKQAPICALVEFDDVDLGLEPDCDEDGVPRAAEGGGGILHRPRWFFPSTVDAFGEAAARRVLHEAA